MKAQNYFTSVEESIMAKIGLSHFEELQKEAVRE
jgi:hypothetical protein